jgi:hypothetical protein
VPQELDRRGNGEVNRQDVESSSAALSIDILSRSALKVPVIGIKAVAERSFRAPTAT